MTHISVEIKTSAGDAVDACIIRVQRTKTLFPITPAVRTAWIDGSRIELQMEYAHIIGDTQSYI
jgi:hypothetical protein